jgi:NAD(P)-dependent dehydrogenase (short-subunit alcohol dehydrogenase family)
MASRSHEKAKAAMSEIEAAGIKGALSTVQLDVTDEKSIEEAVAQVDQQFGRLDVLLNNAASGSMDPNVKIRFQLCLETNVTGPAMVAAAFRPLLLKSQTPYSIFVSSGERTLLRNATQQPPSHASIRNGDAYMVSKAALNMLAVLEARDFGPQGLKVFALSPGFVRSNLRGDK